MFLRKTLALAWFIALCSTLLRAAEPSAGSQAPLHEGRGFWCHSETGPYPGDWERAAKELGHAGFNMIMPNMLWGGSAAYASDVLPPSANVARHGDQIKQCVEAAHRHGLEVHVWKVNWNLGHLAPKEFIEQLRKAGRTQVAADGKPTNWLCPSHPANFKLELASMIEVARKYPVDGLHFDYIRYPNRDFCYCKGCRKRFEAASGKQVADWPKDCHSGTRRAEYNDWRCKQITRLVAAVARQAKKVRPGIKISAAVFGGYPSCKNSIAQDWVAWVNAGYLDFLCPMDYTNSDKAFSSLVENQVRLVAGKTPVYPGIGATSSHSRLPPDQVLNQIRVTRQHGAGGFMIFNLSAETAEKIVPAVAHSVENKPSAPPHRAAGREP